jgi:hypothetical protein
MTKSFDDAKPQIRNKLFRESRVKAQKDFVDGLKGKAKIEINEANLAKVRIDTSAATDDGHGHDLVAPPLPGATTGSAQNPKAPAKSGNQNPEIDGVGPASSPGKDNP